MSASSTVVADDLVSRDSFPAVARLGGKLGERAASELGEACALLRKSGAPSAAKRIAGIDSLIGKADFPALERIADPDGAADEIAASSQRPVRIVHTLRNIFALLPLLFTWIALGLASRAYTADLTAHPGNSTKPFLFLWEQGFGSGFPTFADVAFIDFVILLVVIGMTGWVHQVESNAARSQTVVIDTLYSALNTLAAATEQATARPPASAEEWADAARRIIADAMDETRLLAQTSHQAIEEAGVRLSGIQDEGRDFIERFATEIQQTMASVREQNEQFIIQTARESRETLQRLVEQQMEPLLSQLNTMLAEFGRHQDAYRTEVAGLTQGVTSIRTASRELADSAHSYRESADTMNENLAKITSSQQDFTARISGSVASMSTAATAMGEAKDVLHSMGEGVRQMSADIVDASHSLDTVQRNLASTTSALSDSTAALNKATRELRGAASSIGSSVSRRKEHWWQLWR